MKIPAWPLKAYNNIVCFLKVYHSIAGMIHKLSSDRQAVVKDAMLVCGRTRAFSVKDHPNLTFVAWHEGDVR
jgi:hypothetical protein